MSTKVRYVLSLGNYYKGADVIRLLTQDSPKTMQDFQKMAQAANGRLWVFREPRNIPYMRSRYKQFCAKLGLGRDLKKKAKKPLTVADFLTHEEPNGNNPQYGFTGNGNGGVLGQTQPAPQPTVTYAINYPYHP